MTKSWYQSKTIWGAILLLISTVGAYFGLNLGVEDQATATDSIIAIVDAIVGLVGFILTIIGRVKAVKPVTK